MLSFRFVHLLYRQVITLANKPQSNPKFKFTDVSSSSRPKGIKSRWKHFCRHKLKPFFYRNHKRNLKALISIVVCFVLLLGVTGFLFADRFLSKIGYNEGYSGDMNATFEEEEDISYESMYDVDADSLNELLKAWATNGGEKMKSKNVVNVLLIGHDGDAQSTRSDSMMLVSLNKKTKQIVLTSFLRDSYTYMDINGSERYDKTNHSYAWGGVNALIETLENNYKIEIDHYVTIDFKSFVKAIDAVGGVNVEVTEKEAAYMNRTTHFDDFKSGDSVHLDGEHALIFSRIRKLDDEAKRTDRQKRVIGALIQSTKSATVSELTALVDSVLPYVATNYTKRELVSLATQAITGGWMNFPITNQTEPEEEFREGVEMKTWSYPNLFVWVVDYPLAAQKLQTSVYGSSNIEIDLATHQSALDLLRSKSIEEENNDSSEYYSEYGYDYNYGDDYGYGRNYTTTRKKLGDWSISFPSITWGGGENENTTSNYYSEDTTHSYYEEEPTTQYQGEEEENPINNDTF